jgi:hypothetical protein
VREALESCDRIKRKEARATEIDFNEEMDSEMSEEMKESEMNGCSSRREKFIEKTAPAEQMMSGEERERAAKFLID